MMIQAVIVSLLIGSFGTETEARECYQHYGADEIPDHIGQISSDGVLGKNYTINEMSCTRRCRDVDGCQSFFYNRDTHLCQLHDTGLHMSSSYSGAPGYHHYKMKARKLPIDCYDILLEGCSTSGVYNVYPGGILKEVYCDQHTDGGGWLVFQRRIDGSEDFYRGWDDYEQGFGNIHNEFWLGNQFLANLTSQREYALRVDVENFENEARFAQYGRFNVESSSTNYKLRVEEYSGSAVFVFAFRIIQCIAGDAFKRQNGYEFTTKDRDNDIDTTGNCAVKYKGGWWYQKCHDSNLNGLYLKQNHLTFADGVNWYQWMGYYYSLKKAEMKCRPVNF